MAFFKSLFRNPLDMEDESYVLDSLEKGAPIEDSLSGEHTYTHPKIRSYGADSLHDTGAGRQRCTDGYR